MHWGLGCGFVSLLLRLPAANCLFFKFLRVLAQQSVSAYPDRRSVIHRCCWPPVRWLKTVPCSHLRRPPLRKNAPLDVSQTLAMTMHRVGALTQPHTDCTMVGVPQGELHQDAAPLPASIAQAHIIRSDCRHTPARHRAGPHQVGAPPPAHTAACQLDEPFDELADSSLRRHRSASLLPDSAQRYGTLVKTRSAAGGQGASEQPADGAQQVGGDESCSRRCQTGPLPPSQPSLVVDLIACRRRRPLW